MNDCLLTKLPVVVSGDREKFGYFMLKDGSDDTNINIRVVNCAPYWLRWNNTTVYLGDQTAVGRKQLTTETLYSLTWKPDIGTDTSQITAWIEKEPVRALDVLYPNVFPEDSGFEWLLSNSSNLEYLDIRTHTTLDVSKFKGTGRFCLKIDVSTLQNYQIQELLNRCPNIIYIFLHQNNLGTSANENISNSLVKNVVFPDNLKYIMNSPNKITNLSANCVEVQLQNNCEGHIEDFVAKAVAADRKDGALTVYKGTALSNNLKIYDADEQDYVPVQTELTKLGRTGAYFNIEWATVSEETTISLTNASGLRSRDITIQNYRDNDKLGPEFTE